MSSLVDGVSLEEPAPGRNLAPRAFTSREIFELEQRAIFARSWVHVADLRDVANPGDYATGMIGTTPVMLVRDRKTGELRGFLNACRHRGAQLLEGNGTCDKQIKCPYHAWSYGFDGALLGVPYRDEFTCDANDLGLIPIRIGIAGPMIFANLDPTAPAFADWIGELPASLEKVGASSWEFAYEVTYEIDANWKIFVENANDGLHVQFVHDILTDLLVAESGDTTLEAHSAYTWAQVNPSYVPPDKDPADAKIRFGCIFPNLIPVLSPSDLTYLRVDPISHDKLRLVARSYDTPEFAQFRELRKLAFERTTQQDIAVVLRTQRGLHAAGLPAGVHASRLEARIGHLERMWARAMAAEVGESRRHLAVAR